MKSLLLMLLLSGCATSNGSNFSATTASDRLIAAMATDAAAQIKRLYPAQKTKLSVITTNKFGAALSAELRKSGFAIAEKDGASLNYAVDKFDSKVYRTSLSIDKKTLSRAYYDNEKSSFVSDWAVNNGR
jgi:Conjugal transfer protein TrbH